MPQVTVRDIVQHFFEIDEDSKYFDHIVTGTVEALKDLIEPAPEVLETR